MMEQYPFIFSSQSKYRIRRHLAFWIFWWFFQGFLYAFTPKPEGFDYLHRLPASMLDSLVYLGSHIFLAYSLMYFVIPRYIIKGKYLTAALWVSFLFIVTAAISSLMGRYMVNPLRKLILSGEFLYYNMHVGYNFFLSLLAGLRGGITIAGIAAAIKLMKHWYVKEQQRLHLEKENISTQLQLLKAQIHPHFLFNTLNNIYSYTQDVTPTGSRLVLGLSDILRYMLYETSQPLVPLAKEIKMLKDYLVLEKIRYDNKFEMNIDLPDAGAVQHLQIAPLLLLPFAENAFKHGASNIPDHPWVNIYAAVHEKKFSYKVVNGKPVNAEKNHEQGIGIKNVQRRLELLYPGRHRLEIHNEEDVFIVNLELELDEKPGVIVKERKNILIPHV